MNMKITQAVPVSLEDFEQVNDRIDASPVVQLVNSMIREAIQMNASDIHIEPLPQMTRVRFRVDGSLFEHTMLKNNIHGINRNSYQDFGWFKYC